MKKWIIILIPLLISLAIPNSILAQNYLFSLDKLDVHVFVNEDGSVSIDYIFTFTNDLSASPIDFVDVGLPSNNFDENAVIADVSGERVGVSRSDYQGSGSGIAVVMGGKAVQPGQTGTVHVVVPNIDPWLYEDSQDKDYASFVFAPVTFGRQYMTGTTDISVTIHFPPGLSPDQPRWHSAPSGFPSEPITGFDDQNRITYTWNNPQADGSEQYKFGISFPAQFVPASAITRPSFWETIGIDEGTFYTFLCCGGFFAIIIALGWWGSKNASKRKMQYLPPKVSIEGLGIKRGLTAAEAAILMEQPLEKILTMILFGVLKKEAATVTKKEPLTLQLSDPVPQELKDYEITFLNAFKKPEGKERQLALQNMTIDLVQSVSNIMKGFSRKETVAYYRDIIERAWSQVEAAQTPEVKSQKYDEVMQWTMLDKDYEDRTRDVFQTGPVFVPTWWGRFDPGFGRPTGTSAPKPLAAPVPSSVGGGKDFSLPTLPGATFAASVANSVQNFSSGVVGNITDFTSKITQKTNPVPVTTSSGRSFSSRSGGSGHSCACACACAGCACACAGGGR